MKAGRGVSVWSTRPLAECGRILSGGTPSKAVDANWNGTIPWISAKSLKSFYVTDSEDRLTEAGAAQGSKIVPRGSILFVVRGMSLANEFRVGLAGRAVAFNQDVRALIPHDDVMPEYLAHYLRASEKPVLELVDAASHGTTRLTSDRIEALPVPLPPLAEQRRISGILDQADVLRAKRRAALAQVDGLTQAIFLEMFGDPRENPRNWPVGPMSDFIAGFESGKSFESEANEGLATRFRVLKVSAVTDWVFRPDESKPVPEGYSPPTSHSVQPGDLLFSRANTSALVGAVALVRSFEGELLLPDKIWRFVWKDPDRAEPLFVWSLFRTPAVRREISRRATGTSGSMKNISQEKVLGISIIQPPPSLQREFARRAAAAEKLKAAHRASLAQLDALFASLQHRAFRGEL